MTLNTKLMGREAKMALRDELVESIVYIIDERVKAVTEGKIPNSEESTWKLKVILDDLFELQEVDWEYL